MGLEKLSFCDNEFCFVFFFEKFIDQVLKNGDLPKRITEMQQLSVENNMRNLYSY